MEEKTTVQVKKPERRNWKNLRQEFVLGKWERIKDFFIDKNISQNYYYLTSGWLKEKRSLLEKRYEIVKTKVVEQDAENVVDVRKRQARLAKFLQLKGAKKLESLEPQTVDEARRLVVTGMKEERQALGIDGINRQSLTQININNPKTNLDRIIEGLDYEGILGLIAELRRERVERSRTATLDAVSGEVKEGEVV